MTRSRTVESSQPGIHPRLEAELARHAAFPPRGPIAPYNREAFEASLVAWRTWSSAAPLILDTGCGVGMSTVNLARLYPDHFVIGVDKSLDRLSRGKPWADGGLPENCVLVRADLPDFWRLMAEAGVTLARHYFLYPNPWPKVGHLSRRWQGHAAFPTAVALGGMIECRSNWRLYVEEFAFALTFLTGREVVSEACHPDVPFTPFEKKYQDSGHGLFRCVLDV
ncbi:MAG: SAM-dependent methyltransferase [Rhodocyclaceae bacterium]|nr:SAM-dependent methyltransferase [Rhodocyclaceae bacterium]